MRLVSAPAQCTASVEKPHDDNFPATQRFDQSLMTSEANIGMGASFSNRISVTCRMTRDASAQLFAGLRWWRRSRSGPDDECAREPLSDAWAQAGPFGDIRPPAAAGFAGWLLAKQALFYRALAGLIRAAKTDGSAYWGLMGISFVYGIFHAAGPGHGKAVISSYLLANEETWRRGVVLSFASALLQAATAVAIVADRRGADRRHREDDGRARCASSSSSATRSSCWSACGSSG